MAELWNRYCSLFAGDESVNNLSFLAWVADSLDEWSLTDDDEETVTEYEIDDEESVEQSHCSDSSTTAAEITVSLASTILLH